MTHRRSSHGSLQKSKLRPLYFMQSPTIFLNLLHKRSVTRRITWAADRSSSSKNTVPNQELHSSMHSVPDVKLLVRACSLPNLRSDLQVLLLHLHGNILPYPTSAASCHPCTCISMRARRMHMQLQAKRADHCQQAQLQALCHLEFCVACAEEMSLKHGRQHA